MNHAQQSRLHMTATKLEFWSLHLFTQPEYSVMLTPQVVSHNSRVVNDLTQFKKEADVILENRITDDIKEVADKVYSRDLFGNE